MKMNRAYLYRRCRKKLSQWSFLVFLYILVLIGIPSLIHMNYLGEDAYVFNFFMIGFLVRFGFGFLVSSIDTEEQSWWGLRFQLRMSSLLVTRFENKAESQVKIWRTVSN